MLLLILYLRTGVWGTICEVDWSVFPDASVEAREKSKGDTLITAFLGISDVFTCFCCSPPISSHHQESPNSSMKRQVSSFPFLYFSHFGRGTRKKT